MGDIHLNRQYFFNIEQHVNHADYLNYVCLNKIEELKIDQLDAKNNSEIIQQIHQNGFALINLKSINFSIEDLAYWQENILGPLMNNKNPQNLPYCKVEAVNNSPYFVHSSKSQPLHTDEGYTTNYPKYVSLYCTHQSDMGGDSVLFDFHSFYPELQARFQDILMDLADPGAIIIEGIGGMKSKPLLLFDNGIPGISYCVTLKSMSCSQNVFSAFDYITNFIHNPHNQIRFKLAEKQLLIIDNTRMLHGRTAFEEGNDRLLYRFWFTSRML